MKSFAATIKLIALGAVGWAGAGFGAFLYAPKTGFMFSGGPLNVERVFLEMAIWGFWGAFFAPYGALFALAIVGVGVAWSATKHPSHFLRPFGWFLLAAYFIGLGCGLMSSLVAGHVPDVSM